MTKITKNFITFVMAIALFAAMTTSAFASVNTTGWTMEQREAYRADKAEAAKFKQECGIIADKAHREMIAELLPYGYYFQMCYYGADSDAKIKDVAYIVTQILEDAGVVLPRYDHCPITGYADDDQPIMWQVPNMLETGIIDGTMIAETNPQKLNAGTELVDRERLAIILARAVHYRGLNGNGVIPAIKDIDQFTSDEGKEAAKLIVGYGFLHRDANGNFNPQTNATGNDLIEVALRMHRYMQDVPLPQYIVDRNTEVKAVQIVPR